LTIYHTQKFEVSLSLSLSISVVNEKMGGWECYILQGLSCSDGQQLSVIPLPAARKRKVLEDKLLALHERWCQVYSCIFHIPLHSTLCYPNWILVCDTNLVCFTAILEERCIWYSYKYSNFCWVSHILIFKEGLWGHCCRGTVIV
jgi:hypothetical protein